MQGMHTDEIAMVLQHHVRLDGKGYPELSSTADIHPLAQAIGLADCYDALTTTRPYQRSHHPSDAARIIRLKVGTLYSSRFAEQYLTMLGTYPVGEAVRLATGEIAVVVENGPVDATTPTSVNVAQATAPLAFMARTSRIKAAPVALQAAIR